MIIQFLLGTAFLIAPNTYVSTAHQHGIVDDPMDIKVVQMESVDEPLATECREMQVGDKVWTMGYPLGWGNTLQFRYGEVTSVTGNRFRTTIPATAGFSGSPVFSGGTAIGVITHGIQDEHYRPVGNISTSLCEIL